MSFTRRWCLALEDQDKSNALVSLWDQIYLLRNGEEDENSPQGGITLIALTVNPYPPTNDHPSTTSNQTETVLGLLQQNLYHGLADRYVDDDAQFLALGDIYDRLPSSNRRGGKGVQLPALPAVV